MTAKTNSSSTCEESGRVYPASPLAEPSAGEVSLAKAEEHAEPSPEADEDRGLWGKIVSLFKRFFRSRSFVPQLFRYASVGFTQTFVEFGVFMSLRIIGIPLHIANVFAVACSGTYNFLMNREVTFEKTGHLLRSLCQFIVLLCWNYLFSSTCMHFLPDILGVPAYAIKFATMLIAGCWGFLICRYIIYR